VNNKTEHSDNRPARQGAGEDIPEPNKIGASTPYDFEGRNLTAYGGLLPVATMLEKLGFQQLVWSKNSSTNEFNQLPRLK